MRVLWPDSLYTAAISRIRGFYHLEQCCIAICKTVLLINSILDPSFCKESTGRYSNKTFSKNCRLRKSAKTFSVTVTEHFLCVHLGDGWISCSSPALKNVFSASSIPVSHGGQPGVEGSKAFRYRFIGRNVCHLFLGCMANARSCRNCRVRFQSSGSELRLHPAHRHGRGTQAVTMKSSKTREETKWIKWTNHFLVGSQSPQNLDGYYAVITFQMTQPFLQSQRLGARWKCVSSWPPARLKPQGLWSSPDFFVEPFWWLVLRTQNVLLFCWDLLFEFLRRSTKTQKKPTWENMSYA